MKRTALRVEPISTYLERYRKGSRAFPVSIGGNMVFVSGLPPFDPETGGIKPVPFARQAELIMAQMKHCLEAAGTTLDGVLKCNVYCVPGEGRFQTFNEICGGAVRPSNAAKTPHGCRCGQNERSAADAGLLS